MEFSGKYKQDLTFERKNTFKNPIILVDGQGRSGKNLISVLLSTMKKVEKMRLDSNFDNIPRFFYANKISLDAAVTALRVEADEKHFSNFIARDINFRLSDYSGIFRQGKRLSYLVRAVKSETESRLNKFRESDTIFQEMTHDGLHVSKLYFESFGSRVKIIHIFRDPIGNIFEQSRRNFGERIGNDPREFQLTFNWNGKPVPLMAIGREEEYLRGNFTEKIIVLVDNMFRANINGFLNVQEKFKSQIMFLEFEEFVVNPTLYLTGIENFVGDKFGFSKNRILRREKCPRIIDPKVREEHRNSIRSSISPYFQEMLDRLLAEYDLKPWKDWGFQID
jgi:hypothetical protein